MTTVRRAVKNVVGNYSDIQVKVREATSNDPWGPSGALMSDIADSTYNVIAFEEVISLLWKRLNDSGRNWRHVYKALVVLDYILKTGSGRVVEHCRDNIFTIQTLKDFLFVDKEGKDQGVNVRERSKQLVALVKDDERLAYEREKAIKAKERFHSTTPVGNSAAGSTRRRNSLDSTQSPAKNNSHLATPAITNNLNPNNGSQSWQGQRRANSSTPTAGSGASETRSGATMSSDMERAKPASEQEEALQLELAMALSRQEAEAAQKQKNQQSAVLNNAPQASAPMASAASTFPPSAVPDGAMYAAARPRPATTGPWGEVTAAEPAASSAAPAQKGAWENFESEEQSIVASVVDPWGPPAVAPSAAAAPPVVSTPELFPSSNGFGSPSVKMRTPAGYDPQPLAASMGSMEISHAMSKDESLEKKFLGDNSSLVNLGNIRGTTPAVASGANNNPFGTPMMPAGMGMKAPSSNPFEKGKPQMKSLNEMRTREFNAASAGGELLPAPLVPESQSDVRRGSSATITPGPTMAPMPMGMMNHPMAQAAMMQQPMMGMQPVGVMPVQPMQPAGAFPAQNRFAAGGNPTGFY